MMMIHFDSEKETWYHQNPHQSWSWGHEKMELPFQQQTSPITFAMRTYKGKAGPIVGLLTSEKMIVQLQKGRSKHFLDLHNALQKQGGLLLVFSPESVHQAYIKGIVYNNTDEKWLEVIAPFPDIIYNRFPGRRREKKGVYQHVHERCQKEQIPFFNPHFFSKWNLYELFVQNPFLAEHLPKSVQYKNEQTISAMLYKYSSIYIKPSEGSKGTGVYRVTKRPDGQFLVETTKQAIIYKQLHDFICTSSFNENWLVQEAIESDKIDGKRYDLRLIAVRSKRQHEMSGIGIRQSFTQDVTTHVPNGGLIIPFSQVRDRIHLSVLKTIVSACGYELEKAYGLIGEFSIDMIKSTEGRYYMLEVNAKPMTFDEPDIQQKRLTNLCSLFYHLSRFPSPLL